MTITIYKNDSVIYKNTGLKRFVVNSDGELKFTNGTTNVYFTRDNYDFYEIGESDEKKAFRQFLSDKSTEFYEESKKHPRISQAYVENIDRAWILLHIIQEFEERFMNNGKK